MQHLLLALCLNFFLFAQAAAGYPAPAANAPTAESGGQTLASTASATTVQALKTAGLALALCSAFLIGAYWLRRLRGEQPGRLLKVVEVTPLGNARTLTVIEINGSRYLIGSTAQNISLLTKLEGQPEQEAFPVIGSKAGGTAVKRERWSQSEVISRLRELHRALRF